MGEFPGIWAENPQLGFWAHSPGSYFSLRSQKTHRIQVTVSSQRLLHKEKIWGLECKFIYLKIGFCNQKDQTNKT